ncbi:MAG: hypothetical protein CME70_00825 [Halobacteriovorax sp.]|nr:hypothetical protein [Halobacteriovorax sp.]|tara:strand:- start:3374 stop:3679 length:306 start_codon:yes stop_codon:yes gene_type:complete
MIQNTVIEQDFTAIISGDASSASVGLYFCNATLSPDSLTLYAMPSGAPHDDSNTIIKNLPIQPEDTFYFGDEKFILSKGDAIGATALVGGRITATVTSIEI